MTPDRYHHSYSIHAASRAARLLFGSGPRKAKEGKRETGSQGGWGKKKVAGTPQ